MAPDANAPSKRSPADQEYSACRGLGPRLFFVDASSKVFTPGYIALHAKKFLDDVDQNWVDITALKDYLQQFSTPSASFPLPPEVTDPVKIEPPSATTHLNEDGREVLEILSDSEPDVDNRDSDLEVMDALRPSSRSSSVIPSPYVDPRVSDSEGLDMAGRDIASSSFSDADNFESDCEESRKYAPADTADLVESDTVWQDDGTSLVRIGQFRPTRRTTVQRMEYRTGPALLYPIHRVRTGIVVDLSDYKYWFRDPTTKELITLQSIIFNSDNDSWDWGGGGASAKAKHQ